MDIIRLKMLNITHPMNVPNWISRLNKENNSVYVIIRHHLLVRRDNALLLRELTAYRILVVPVEKSVAQKKRLYILSNGLKALSHKAKKIFLASLGHLNSRRRV